MNNPDKVLRYTVLQLKPLSVQLYIHPARKGTKKITDAITHFLAKGMCPISTVKNKGLTKW